MFPMTFANKCEKLRFFNQYSQSKTRRLFLDNMMAIGMIQQCLTTQTPQLLPLRFCAYIMKDGKVLYFFDLFIC